VSSQFLADFEKSGIHLPKKERDKFVSLSDDILSLGRAFTAPTSESTGSTESASDQVFITLANLERWNPAFVRSIVDNEYDRSTWDKSGVYISASSQEGQAIRRDHPSSSIREQFYRAAYPSADNERLEALEQLLTKRAELARLVGKDSWAHVTLSDKMAKSPENVMSFLTSLSERNKPLASRDVSSLADFKSLFERDQTSPQNLEAWDRDFYMVKSMQANNVPSPSSIAPYFSVGSCIAGLSALFSRIYGIRFEVEECQPGEIWLPDQVRKISVYDESEGKIGEIYCDLFVREGKPQGAAHFTVRCSRRLDDDTAEHDLQFMQGSSRAGLELPVTSKPVEYRGRKGKYQLPIVVLTCDFEAPTNNSPGLLTRQEAETLFHEMGHAMHCMSTDLLCLKTSLILTHEPIQP
jgi:intermediate peptidase